MARRLRLLHELRLAPGRSLRRPRCSCRRLGPRLRQGRLEGFGRILTRLRLRGVELGDVAALEILSQAPSLVGLHASDLERLIERFELRRSPSRLAVDSTGSVPAGVCCGSRATETCETLVATGYQQYRSHGKTEATPRVPLSAIIADLRRDGCISSEKSREDHAVQQERFGALLHATCLRSVAAFVWGNKWPSAPRPTPHIRRALPLEPFPSPRALHNLKRSLQARRLNLSSSFYSRTSRHPACHRRTCRV